MVLLPNNKIFNNMGKYILTFLVFGLILTGNLKSQKSYEIKVNVKPFKDTILVLGHHFGSSIYPDDTAKVDKNGNGVFKKNKVLPGGLYIVYLPNRTYFDVIIDKNQQFSIENDTTDLFKNARFKNSPDNDEFYKYQMFLAGNRDKMKQFGEIKKNSKTQKTKDSINAEIRKIDESVKEYVKQLSARAPESFVAKFVKSTQEIDVPDAPKDAKGNIIDSLFQYRYYKENYFANLDLSDPRLIRTPAAIYEQKVKTYIDRVIPQIPDSINKEIDMLISKARTSDDLFRYMLVTLYNHYGQSQIMGFDAVHVHIIEKYYIPEAHWADTTSISKLKDYVKRTKPLLLEKKAPDAKLIKIDKEHFMAASKDEALKKNVYVGSEITIHTLKAEFLVLIFWDPDCGHCKKSLPELYEVYNKLKDYQVEFLSTCVVFGEEGKVKWINTINEKGYYNWINAWNPYSYQYKEDYDISSTPQIYILDKDKKIIAKKVGSEQIEEIVKTLSKRKNVK